MTQPPKDTRYPPGLAIKLVKHPLHDLLPGVNKNVLYSLPAKDRDEYVVHALFETANLRRNRRSDALLAAHVGRQARDREFAWPLTETYPPGMIDSDEKLDAIAVEMREIVTTLVKKSHTENVL